MRRLPLPTPTAVSVFELCISKVRNATLRRRLVAISEHVTTAEADYIRQAASQSLHLFPQVANIGGVTRREMMAVYTRRMVSKSQPGRPVYDALIANAPLGRCPLCGVGQVATLDHHLPKSSYPVLAVTPANLLPACSWCQFEKKESHPRRAEEQTLHPYFDNVEDYRWLHAEVIEAAPAAFVFSVSAPAETDPLTVSRLHHHIRVFRLDKLYAANAAEEVVNIRYSLQRLYDAGGSAAVQAHLSDQAISRERAHRNSWQTAMYTAAAASDWFCNRGFGQI